MPHEWHPTAPPMRGRTLVVCGQYSKVGKTTLIVDLLSVLSGEAPAWDAVKITPHIQSGCPLDAHGSSCRSDEHAFAITEEHNLSGETDTSRFLAAGAQRALWLQTKPGHLREALPDLARLLASATHTIIESNAILEFWRPAAVFMVLDPSNPDFKPSAFQAMPLADAFVLRSPFRPSSSSELVATTLSAKPTFLQLLGQPLPASVQDVARQLLGLSSHPIR